MTSDIEPVIISLHADSDSKEAVEFFSWLGRCVAGWAFADRRLYQIFHHATDLEQKQSALFYYGDRTFSRRLRIVDRALKSELTDLEFVNEWRPLHNEARDLSYTRNIFAHHPTLRIGTAKDGRSFDIYSIHIEPYERILNDDYPGLMGKDRLEIEDLKNHEADVSQLERKLHDFAWRMGGLRAAKKGANLETSTLP